MQLNKIKLAGFKSFVDPTSVLLPSNLVAVVGPNGCGKSNIIDAISWVMGESSAKYLRGELMTDVIFNGSTSRKPIGQASVELVFDNQDGTLGGEYGSYTEISIKRQLTRTGDSTYFLNGARCRRRDIIGIFLGTGLGPRSYSIIGQNMISRIIEAKPEEMRVYLEEAAGISKYKERRRETENRIHHTKENLARLSDLRAELEKQLGSLKRQANSAERYKVLKQEERALKGQWYAVQWRQVDARLVQYTLQIQQQETGLEAKQTESGSIDLTLEKRREDQHVATDTFQEVQKLYYTVGNDITRLEQELRHLQERERKQQADLAQIQEETSAAEQQLEELQDQLQELDNEINELQPESEAANAAIAVAMSELTLAEEAAQSWQVNWDEFNQFNAKTTQVAQVEQTRIQHQEQRMTSITQRQTRLAQEQEQCDFTVIEQEIATVAEALQQATVKASEKDAQLRDNREKISSLQTMQQNSSRQLDQVQNSLQKLRGQQASLEALQQTALGQRNNLQVEWLKQNNLDQKSRLAQRIQVQSGWENAVEKVLGANLQAVCVDDIAAIAEQTSKLAKGNIALFSGVETASSNHTAATTLLSKIESKLPLASLLAGIYVADNLQEAIALSSRLGALESVITPDGTWLSAAWLRLSREENPAAGVFQREQELKALAQQITQQETERTAIDTALQDIRAQIKQLEQQRDPLQKSVNESHAEVSEKRAREKMQRERLADLQQRAERIVKEQQECALQLQQAQTELATARSNWQNAMEQLENVAGKRENLLAERDSTRNRSQAARVAVNTAKDTASEFTIRLQTAKSQRGSQMQTQKHMQTQLNSLNQRKAVLEEAIANTESTEALENTLGEALERRLNVEGDLTAARTNLETIEQESRTLETERQTLDKEINRIRDVLQTLRLECEGLKVKAQNFLEQITEMGLQFEELLVGVPEEVNPDDLHAELEQTSLRITRLGPINLVAIEEYATCSERKEYLDKQDADLVDGLNTLEDAIAKIDKETRARFKDTFDKVNEKFQSLFPEVFGGGRAYMEMTGDNLLDSGITVMACPPGKRNSTIHLLSGGEKALTAIALVFSIFHLNPAPFCLLDEVDAPLDDANIVRFCKLLKLMSDKIQFIFISHNKIAIEMAQHLVGVTMHEPGVSRLVTVNMEEAISLAGA
jgi:chromosome segregation protein